MQDTRPRSSNKQVSNGISTLLWGPNIKIIKQRERLQEWGPPIGEVKAMQGRVAAINRNRMFVNVGKQCDVWGVMNIQKN